MSPSDIDKTNPGGWPEAALEMFQRAITVQYTSLTRAGAPIMVPLTPFLGQDPANRRCVDRAHLPHESRAGAPKSQGLLAVQ